MLVSRLPVVYGLIPIGNRRRESIPGRWRHVIYWGGLRGSLSIALVLSIPLLVPDRPILVAMTFGIVVFSLLVQGLTISPLLDALKITDKPPQA
jgi:CPA1 family monovalent cation:H+ antiporter